MNSTPARCSSGRFSSEPRLRRLSNAITSAPAKFLFNEIANAEPTKPAPPVTRIVSAIRRTSAFRGLRFSGRAMVIAPCEVLLEPEIQHDKQIPAAHFLDLQ